MSLASTLGRDFLAETTSKRDWPYLVLTSPFAAKCAVQAAASNPDIGRIPWLAIGEGTARACFRLGVTVAVCAKARNAQQLGGVHHGTVPNLDGPHAAPFKPCVAGV